MRPIFQMIEFVLTLCLFVCMAPLVIIAGLFAIAVGDLPTRRDWLN